MLKHADIYIYIYRISRLCLPSGEFYKPAAPKYFGAAGFAV